MNLFQILVKVECDESMQALVAAVKFVIEVIRWLVPAVLIVLGSIDMFKAMANGKEDEQKKAQKTFIRRLIYGLIIFLIPFIVNLAFSLLSNVFGSSVEGTDAKSDFFSCYTTSEVSKGKCMSSDNVQVVLSKDKCLSDGYTWVD